MWLEILRVTQGCARVNQVSGTLFWVDSRFHWFQPCRGYVPKWGNSVALEVIHHFNTVYSNPGVRERDTSDWVIPFLVKRTLVSLFSKGIFHILSDKGNKTIIQNSPVLAQMRGYPLGCAHQDYPLWHAYLWACLKIMIQFWTIPRCMICPGYACNRPCDHWTSACWAPSYFCLNRWWFDKMISETCRNRARRIFTG